MRNLFKHFTLEQLEANVGEINNKQCYLVEESDFANDDQAKELGFIWHDGFGLWFIEKPTRGNKRVDVTFTNDLGEKVTMDEVEFAKEVINAINFAINDKGYELEYITTSFVVEDITGNIESLSGVRNDMNVRGLCIVNDILKIFKGSGVLKVIADDK